MSCRLTEALGACGGTPDSFQVSIKSKETYWGDSPSTSTTGGGQSASEVSWPFCPVKTFWLETSPARIGLLAKH